MTWTREHPRRNEQVVVSASVPETARSTGARSTGALARRRLSPRARAVLNGIRGLAAVEVVGHHVVAYYAGPLLLRLVFDFGQEAVMVFFLLSGFVIFLNDSERAARPRSFYWHRLRRIYPPLLLSLVVSLVIAFSAGTLSTQFRWGQELGTIFSLQDLGELKPGVIVNPPMGNLALWSLSYEVSFYALFPVLMVAFRRRPRLTRHAIGAVAVAAYLSYMALPNHACLVLAYLLVWWSGCALADAYQGSGVRWRTLAPELGWMTALATASVAAALTHPDHGWALYPLLMIRHFVFALVCLVAITVVSGRRVRPPHWLGGTVDRVAGPAAAIASISYGLYIFHWPLMIQSPLAGHGPIGFLLSLAALVVLAALGDRYLGALGRTRRSQAADTSPTTARIRGARTRSAASAAPASRKD